MDSIITELNTLAKRYKTNNKLSKTDQNQALELLPLLLVNSDTLAQGMEFIFRLPAVTVSEAFWMAWKNSSVEIQQLLIEKLSSHKDIGSKAGNTRELLIIKKLMGVSGEVAAKLLTGWCLRATKDAQKIPNKSNAELFCKEIINENLILRTDLNGKVIPREMSAISLMILYSLFSDISIPNHPERAAYYFDWIKNSNIPLSFPPATGKQLNEMIKDWPEELVNRISELKVLPNIIREHPLRAPAKITETTKSAGLEQTWKPIAKPDVKSSETPNARHTGIFDAKESLEKIKSYINDLEGQLAKLRVVSNDAEKNHEREKNHRMSVQNRLMETEEQLKISHGIIEKLQAELYQAQVTTKRFEEELNNTRTIHREKVDNLLDISEHEVNYAVKEFQNVLTRDLRLEYTDFMAVINEEITPDLAENFKDQLISIFNILRSKGLKL